MCVVNHQYKYIFFHEPHCAGRAIEEALMKHEGSQNFNGHHHITTIEMMKRDWVTKKQFEDYYKFRVIRNPYEWLVTAWIVNNRQRTHFDEWVLGSGRSFMVHGTLFWRYQIEAQYYLKCEFLSEHLNRTLKNIEAPPVVLDRIGETKGKMDWADLLTVNQARHLEGLYPDIKTFGYSIFE